MLFKDLSIKDKIMDTCNYYVGFELPDISDEQLKELELRYSIALKAIEDNKERLATLIAIKNYGYHVCGMENPNSSDHEFENEIDHVEDTLNDFILTNF
jgi:hypothetical protein